MNFQKYPSIENTYRQEFIQHIIDEGKTDGVWVVTEKIHGANFSFWCDRKQVRMAKRSCLIADDDNFYGAQNIKHELIDPIYDLFARIRKARNPGLKYMGVFGELFGGNYPHPKVKADPQARQVQKGIHYCPNNQFLIFDIKLDDEFLDFNEMQEWCEGFNLPYIKALATGTFKECLKYKNKFSSTIHKYYHLPKIKDNICEGIVIRPNKNKTLYRGQRVILKSKNAKWSENVHARKPVETISLSEEGEKVKEEIRSMITENRFNSITSQIGEVTAIHFGEIMREFNKDILKEAEKSDLIYQFNILDKNEQKIIKKSMNHNIANLVREKLILGK